MTWISSTSYARGRREIGRQFLRIAFFPTSLAALPACGLSPSDNPRLVLEAIDARQGFAAITETRDKVSKSTSGMRIRYWRGPCMLYWLGAGERAAGNIHWQSIQDANLDHEGRLVLTGRYNTERLVIAFADILTQVERQEAVTAANGVIQSCKAP